MAVPVRFPKPSIIKSKRSRWSLIEPLIEKELVSKIRGLNRVRHSRRQQVGIRSHKRMRSVVVARWVSRQIGAANRNRIDVVTGEVGIPGKILAFIRLMPIK